MNIHEPSFHLFPAQDCRRVSYLNGVLPLGEVDGTLAELVGGLGTLVLGETAADLTSELGAEVEREVLLVLVEQTQLSALVGVDDGENTSDRLANLAAKKKIPVSIKSRKLMTPSIARFVLDRIIPLFLIDRLVECWRSPPLVCCLSRVRSFPSRKSSNSIRTKNQISGVSDTHIL